MNTCFEEDYIPVKIIEEMSEFETWEIALRIGFACSPILIIAYILMTAREDEETEKKKLEEAKKSDSCKS